MTLVVLAFVSIHSLNPTSVGLDYNYITFQVDTSRAYPPGRYFLGPTHTFLTFPTNVIRLQFDDHSYSSEEFASLSARTRDGLSVKLDTAFQFQLNATHNQLYAIYSNYKLDYVNAFGKIARDVLRNVAADYNAFSFFQDRDGLTRSMEHALRAELKPHGAFVLRFDILNIALPWSIIDAIERTEVARQEIARAGFEQSREIESSKTRVLTAIKEASRIVLLQNATGYAYYQKKAYESQTVIAKLLQATAENTQIASTLSFNASQLLTYLWMKNLQLAQVANVNMDLDVPTVFSP